MVMSMYHFIYLGIEVCRQEGNHEQNSSRTDRGSTYILHDSANEQKVIALTFDDGPHPVCTRRLLDELKKREIKATFFVIGQQASMYPDIIERMNEEGHQIGNHTYTHIALEKNNREKYIQELKDTNILLSDLTGKEVLFVRPPYGKWDKGFEKKLNMFPILWSIDPLDWCCSDVGRIVKKVVNTAKDEDIILLHDVYDTSVEAAIQIIDILQEKGFVFVTVEELYL